MAGDGDGVRDQKPDVKHQKSYFDVLGLCCTSEEALVLKMLNSLTGVVSVTVSVPSKTVTVVHDAVVISQDDIVKVLNQARLEASVRAYGKQPIIKNWPNVYTLVSGTLFSISLFGLIYHPLHWVAVGAAAVGIFPIVCRTWAALRVPMMDFNFLMIVAVIGSIVLKDYYEAAAIVFLFNLAEWLQSRSTYKAKAVMLSLMSMAPQKAVLADSGIVMDVRDVKVNTNLAIKAGEVIPIDGMVIEGNCEVDESSLTGESFPVVKEIHSLVWAGTHNINGYITIKTTALAENSAVAKMTKLVEEAQNSKSRINRMIDSCVKYYTPAIIFAAVAVAVIPTAMRLHNLRHWFRLALVLLVSACPCALVLSTPVATFCALNRAATTGLLVKGGDYLEALAQTKIIAFDKTGTLTRGQFSVVDFRSFKGSISMETLLYWVSSIESKSSHPMASALVNHAQLKSIHPSPDNVSQFQIFPGEGIYGEMDGNGIHIGNRRIAFRAGYRTDLNYEKTKGTTVGYVFSGEELVGLFSLSDTCRTGAAEAIKDLKSLGNKVAMLTGDSWDSASAIQGQLGNSIDIVHAELLPEDKVRIVHELKSSVGSTVMVGDGMNDAPALTAADVGISMGISGSAVAMETSHITLMSNDVRKIPEAIKLAKKAKRKIIENIIMSFITKAAIVALAVAGHPLLWAAVLADVGTCLLVVLNSMLLLRKSHKARKTCCSSSHHVSHKHAHAGKHSAEHSHGDSCCKSLVRHEPSVVQNCCSDNVIAKDECCNSKKCNSDSDDHHHHKISCSHAACGPDEHHHQHSVSDADCQSEIVLDSGKRKAKHGHDHHHHHYDEELAASRCCTNEEKDVCGGSVGKPAACITTSGCSDFHMHSDSISNCQDKAIPGLGKQQGHGHHHHDHRHHHHHHNEELAASSCCQNEKKDLYNAGRSSSFVKPAKCSSDFHVHSNADSNYQAGVVADSGTHKLRQGHGGHHHHYDEEMAASRCCPNEKESSHVGCNSSRAAKPSTPASECSSFHMHAGLYQREYGPCCRVECLKESCCGCPDHAIPC